MSLFIGLVFSLGSSSAIANIIAGYMITYRRAFKIGDRVKIGNSVGDVVETRLQVTHLRSVKNEEIVIPNSQILGNDVINFSSLSKTQGLILHTEVGIGYETPWRQVEAMLLTAAERCAPPSGDPPRAFVLLKKLGDFAVTYELNIYCSDVKAMVALYTLMHRHILDVFNEFGVQIMTPAYEGDPAEPKIVPPEDWFAAPAKSRTSEPLAPAAAGARGFVSPAIAGRDRCVMTGIVTSSADAGTLLAVERTRLAYERTMMAWVRTGTSLISFGFTIYKFFQYQIERGQAAAPGRLIGPRTFALMMISMGLVAVPARRRGPPPEH